MTNSRKMIALGVAMAFAVISQLVVAQDDLDDLLKDLENDAKPAAKAEPEPAAPAEKAEEAKEAAPAEEAEAAEEAAPAEKAEEAEESEETEETEEAEEAAPAEESKEAAPAEEAEESEETEETEEAEESPAPAEAATPQPETSQPEPTKEAPVATNSQVDEVMSLLDDLAAETKAEEEGEDEPAKEAAAPAKEDTAPAKEETVSDKEEAVTEKEPEAKEPEPANVKPEVPTPASPDAELIANIRSTEKLRREALDVQAKREILEARQCMSDEEYGEAVRHYGLALKLLNDRPSSKMLRKECDQGVAEGLYRAALQEDELGRRDRAVKLMEKAIDMRHPKARRMLEKWNASDDDGAKAVDNSDFAQRRSEADYKEGREQIKRHLRRSRQYLALRDMKKALEECEIVLVNDPYNQEAIRIRKAIQKKRKVILQQEREAARDGMIADVDEAWRPVYAANAAQLKETSAETVKTQTGEDPERTQEQEIERRMKEMRLPTISFKPPATIIDAVEFFRGASKDYDRPDIPVEKRGFNFVLKTPQGAIKQQAAEDESDDFSGNGDSEEGGTSNGLPPIPTITASDITFYEALKLVCDSVDYKFIVRGPVVMVMQKDMSTAELLSRKYDVLDAFLERMTSASADVKEMRSAGFGGSSSRKQNDDDEENQEKDWKGFFEQMGVKWPEGSSIMYIKTLGKLYVRNTRENLAEFEKVLQEMGSQPKLIEIETRFVEVSQEDLNSLGFEWILNSDYSLNLGQKLGKALGVAGSTWGTEGGERKWENSFGSSWKSDTQNDSLSKEWSKVDTLSQNGGPTSRLTENGSQISDTTTSSTSFGRNGWKNYADTHTRSQPYRSVNGGLIRDVGGDRSLGVNAFGGTSSDYNHGNRYLSDVGNHVSGSDASNNDQFMRVNAFLGQADLSMILHMLSQRSDTDLLSAPKVVTKSGENAVIKVVTEYIYPTDYDVQLQSSSSSGNSTSGGSQSAILAVVEPQNFTMREVGVILDVTPTYSEANGGTIDLELKPSVVDEPTWKNYGMKIPFTGNSSVQSFEGMADIPIRAVEAVTALGGKLTDEAIGQYQDAIMGASLNAMNSTTAENSMTWYEAPMEQPFFPVRSIDSKVSITPGSTVVMGGLITEQRRAMDDKVPFLGDLPFLGRLFRSHAEQTIKKNLLIFVTGRLITPSGRELRVNEETVASEAAEVKPAPKAE